MFYFESGSILLENFMGINNRINRKKNCSINLEIENTLHFVFIKSIMKEICPWAWCFIIRLH